MVDSSPAPTPCLASAPRAAPLRGHRYAAQVAGVWLMVALGVGLVPAPPAHAATPVLPALARVTQPVVGPEAQTSVEPTSCACQDNRARNRNLGGAASAAMALAGLILAVRRYRQRNRLPREDRKFGSYRGPKP